ncbi:sugar (and other) transporter family protein [Paraburkholderia xenovorans LB400]|uniref:Major facilitator superfamily (MFS) aromatic acid/H+ symporter n=1 Tax=Paraburkholderia xenovorans (strain LB400) TaxID=266265 RepID=Q13GE8_PARXL|nr:MFS transporter [Paraburkholderia xenovorans]ABE36841.1 major facilitator superfamily (MFS) aromatic acid/H+ symporter [Paraburkholderia xenovorans LB400]AIP34737.1 sugar (and other) transporter family protein [Paraburkholderia xenovorans LB400]
MQSTAYAASRLDRLPLSGFHWRLLCVIGFGLFLEFFDLYTGGAIVGVLLKQGWSTLQLNALFGTLTFAGLTVGAMMAGIIGDRYGRRLAYQINLVVFGIASFAAAVAPDMYWLSAIRFMMGLGIGAEAVISYGMLGEFVPPGFRGRMLAFLSVFGNSAVFVGSLVNLWVIPHLGWRYVFVIAGILAITLWIVRRSIPESPRWLETKGRIDEAEVVLQRIERSVARGGELPSYAHEVPAPTPQVSIGVLFTPPILVRTLVGSAILVCIGFSIYGLINWLPTFFIQQGFDIVKSLTWTTVITLGGPVGSLLGVAVSDRVGRRPAIIASCVVTAVCGLIYQQVDSAFALMGVGFLLVCSIYVLVAVGQGAYVPELFSTSYRLRGTGVCMTAGRLASAGCQFFILWLFTKGGVLMVVGSVVAAQLLLAFAVWAIRIETRGKRLEDLDSGVPGAPTTERSHSYSSGQ